MYYSLNIKKKILKNIAHSVGERLSDLFQISLCTNFILVKEWQFEADK